jgi:glycosyltransferase involved in cell wall biosynthesis
MSKQPLESPLPDMDKEIRLVIVATLLHAKGQIFAIRALSCLVKEGYDAVIYLAGDCAEEKKDYIKELINIAKNEQILDRVHFLGHRKDIPQILCRSTALLLPSQSEGMPMCILEAMVLGVPVFATAVGSIPQMLVNGKAGHLLNTYINPEEISQAIQDLIINDKIKLQELIILAKITVCKKYSTQFQIDSFEAIIQTS